MTEDKLVLHPATRTALDDFIANPVHAVMISGATGSGKATLANHIVISLLSEGHASFKLENYPYLRILRPIDNRAIPIEAIRELQHMLNLKIPGKHADTTRRAVIIEEAHLMTGEAQNALLKTLEEPPADTVIVLTAAASESVLPTVKSRVRHIPVLLPPSESLLSYFKAKGCDRLAINRALMISGGLPGLTAALLSVDTDHPMVIATAEARAILQSKTYERLLLVDTLSKQKQLCIDIMFVLGQMSRMALMRGTDNIGAQRWQRILRASFSASEQFSNNTQPKLVLTNLMLML